MVQVPSIIVEPRYRSGVDMAGKGKSFDLDIIVDVIFDDGLLYLRLQNIGERPARRVSVAFDCDIAAPHSGRLINDLCLFKSLLFFAPKKSIDVFLGTTSMYFGTGQPEQIRATVQYLDSGGRRRRGHIDHDLRIYTDLGYVRRHYDPPGIVSKSGAADASKL